MRVDYSVCLGCLSRLYQRMPHSFDPAYPDDHAERETHASGGLNVKAIGPDQRAATCSQ